MTQHKILITSILLTLLLFTTPVAAATTAAFIPVPVTPTTQSIFNYTLYTTNLAGGSFILANITFPRLDMVMLNSFKNNTNINGVSFVSTNLSSTVTSVQINATNTSQLFGSGASAQALVDFQFRYYNITSANTDAITLDPSTTQWYGNLTGPNPGFNSFGTLTSGQVVPTLASGFTAQDLSEPATYNLTLLITDSNSGAPIPDCSLIDSNQVTYTTTNGMFNLSYPFSTVVVYISATGYVSKSASYVVDSSQTQTIQLSPTVTLSQAQNTWWTPHTVQVTLMDTYGARLYNVNIKATFNESSMPTSWITQMYGIQSGPQADLLNSSLVMGGITGSDGTLTFTMLGSLKYDIYLNSATYGLTDYHVSAFPSDSMLNIYVVPAGQVLPTSENNTYAGLSNTSVYIVEPNNSWINECINYQDSNQTTLYVNESWYFLNNLSVWQSINVTPTDGGQTPFLNCGLTQNVRGTQTWFGYRYTRST